MVVNHFHCRKVPCDPKDRPGTVFAPGNTSLAIVVTVVAMLILQDEAYQ